MFPRSRDPDAPRAVARGADGTRAHTASGLAALREADATGPRPGADSSSTAAGSLPHARRGPSASAQPRPLARLGALLGSRWGDGAALFVLTLALRLPFQTTVLYHWDSVLYARALAGFDVSESQPHPPGYLFYVAAARVAQLVLGDPNASLVAVSMLAAALTVVGVYLVGRYLYGRD